MEEVDAEEAVVVEEVRTVHVHVHVISQIENLYTCMHLSNLGQIFIGLTEPMKFFAVTALSKLFVSYLIV